jgi:hypothetical protein
MEKLSSARRVTWQWLVGLAKHPNITTTFDMPRILLELLLQKSPVLYTAMQYLYVLVECQFNKYRSQADI